MSMMSTCRFVYKILFRLKHIPIKLWNYDIGAYTRISRKYISISRKGVHIGERCTILPGLRLVTIGTYAGEKFQPQIWIEDNVCINQNFHCTCASSIKIGEGTSITANCGVFDIIHPYQDVSINPRIAKILTKPVEIGKNCLIGMNSVVMPGVKLGNHVIVGANSTITEGVYGDNIVLVGSPARVVKRYNETNGEWEKC